MKMKEKVGMCREADGGPERMKMKAKKGKPRSGQGNGQNEDDSKRRDR